MLSVLVDPLGMLLHVSIELSFRGLFEMVVFTAESELVSGDNAEADGEAEDENGISLFVG